MKKLRYSPEGPQERRDDLKLLPIMPTPGLEVYASHL